MINQKNDKNIYKILIQNVNRCEDSQLIEESDIESVSMSSFNPKYGKNTDTLFDNDFETVIHTADNYSDPGIVTLNLSRPIFVDSVLLVNRNGSNKFKDRIKNATIELVDSNTVTTICGQVDFKTDDLQEVVQVKCKNPHIIKSKQVVLMKDPIRLSINIAELWICRHYAPGML